MKLFFDEDNGTGIPLSFNLLKVPDCEIHFASSKHKQIVQKGTPDCDWIPIAGERGWLVFSQNKHMLENELERELLVSSNVGAVFLDNGSVNSHLVMQLLLNKLDWLKLVDSTIPRPFAYLLSQSGNARLLDITNDSPLHHGGLKVSTRAR